MRSSLSDLRPVISRWSLQNNGIVSKYPPVPRVRSFRCFSLFRLSLFNGDFQTNTLIAGGMSYQTQRGVATDNLLCQG